MIIKHSDARAVDFCNRGMREGFEKRGLDWTTFIKQGYEEIVIRDNFGDGIVDKILEAKRGR